MKTRKWLNRAVIALLILGSGWMASNSGAVVETVAQKLVGLRKDITTIQSFTSKSTVRTGGVFAHGITVTALGSAAPFTINSTKVNTNLNADLLDGQHYTNIQSYAIGLTTGAWRHSNVDAKFNSIAVTSAGLVANLNSDLLDSQQGSYYTGYSDAVSTALNHVRGVLETADTTYATSLTGAIFHEGTIRNLADISYLATAEGYADGQTTAAIGYLTGRDDYNLGRAESFATAADVVTLAGAINYTNDATDTVRTAYQLADTFPAGITFAVNTNGIAIDTSGARIPNDGSTKYILWNDPLNYWRGDGTVKMKSTLNIGTGQWSSWTDTIISPIIKATTFTAKTLNTAAILRGGYAFPAGLDTGVKISAGSGTLAANKTNYITRFYNDAETTERARINTNGEFSQKELNSTWYFDGLSFAGSPTATNNRWLTVNLANDDRTLGWLADGELYSGTDLTKSIVARAINYTNDATDTVRTYADSITGEIKPGRFVKVIDDRGAIWKMSVYHNGAITATIVP